MRASGDQGSEPLSPREAFRKTAWGVVVFAVVVVVITLLAVAYPREVPAVVVFPIMAMALAVYLLFFWRWLGRLREWQRQSARSLQPSCVRALYTPLYTQEIRPS